MLDIKDNDTFWTLVGEFGPGILTVEIDGMLSRPVLPVVDRKLGEAICVVDKAWLTGRSSGGVSTALAFFNEFTATSLHLKGQSFASTSSDDIATGWNSLVDRCYPDGMETEGLIALRTTPLSAELWRLGNARPSRSWKFVSGLIQPRPVH